MASDKSLAAEIERLHRQAAPAPWEPQPGLERERVRGRFWSTCKGFPPKPVGQMSGQETSAERDANMQLACLLRSHVPEILAALRATEIAALQSRAFEDGARWMRWQAQDCLAQMKPTAIMPAASGAGYLKALERADARVAALPLQPEGERSDA